MAKIINFHNLPDRFNVDQWTKQSCEKTINELRKYLGMPPVYEKNTNCRICNKIFLTTYKYDRPLQRWCSTCVATGRLEREGWTE